MKYAMSLMLAASLCGIPMLTGCDKEVSHEKTVSETPSGGAKVEEKTVTQNADGTLNKTTETHRTNP
ncbi:hypothetical protein BH10PLA1_BH10PLA1_19130 [soil metagenome]